MVKRLSLGNFEIWALREGYFYLDGGSMFGVVPKVIWETKSPADHLNRICLATNSLLIRSDKGNVLIETGLGENWPAKFKKIYTIKLEPGLKKALSYAGLKPEDIDFVINTHLHFDHCGHNTEKEGEKFKPTFPRAIYLIQRGEWEAALNPNERDKSSYLKENFWPLLEAGQVELIEGDKEIIPGVKIILTPGHTAYHQSVLIFSGQKKLFFAGDLLPTSAHVGLSYIMSFDLFPLETLKTKKKWLNQAVEEKWIVAYVHDPDYFFTLIGKEKEKYMPIALEELPE